VPSGRLAVAFLRVVASSIVARGAVSVDEMAGGVCHERPLRADPGVEAQEGVAVAADGEAGHPPDALAEDVDDGDIAEFHVAPCCAQVQDGQPRCLGGGLGARVPRAVGFGEGSEEVLDQLGRGGRADGAR